ncbi:MAG: CoB--CoM heterodisulfide reductase iron-sulfur subunit A family protein [Bacteroidales bacterium]|nr:CoB--CoM heterodisulfide reductase iron-sulfur subunit A family protein [Bacteroidales bacterium]
MKNSKHIAIVGAGIAGMETAIQLTRAGYKVTLLEKEKSAGGYLSQWSHLFPDFSDPEEVISQLASALADYNIKTITNTEITDIEKNKGNFVLKASNELSVNADAVVVTSGFQIFDATRKEEYGYGLFENVITSADLEKMFKQKKAITTKGGKSPRRIAIIHCVGSRDAKSGNTYCSKVCCITGIKQAIELSKMLPESEVFCFYMDLRLYGSKFDDLYLKAQKHHKIQFIRGRLSEASEKADKSLQIKAEDTLSGRPLRMDVDMIILLVGMEAGTSNEKFGKKGFIELDENRFLKSENIHTARNCTTQPGVFMAGTCICPMSVNETLENARSAAMKVINYFEKPFVK